MKNRKDDIERYLRGELSPAEMHALEKEALDDPFLAEALEGLEQTKADDFLQDLHRLNRRVHDRTRLRKDKSIALWGWPVGIAATLLLIAVSGFLVIHLVNEQQTRRLALHEELSLLQNSNDTLYVVFPAEALADASQPVRTPSARKIRRRESTSRAQEAAPVERRPADAAAKSVPQPQPTAEQESIALADIPEPNPESAPDEIATAPEADRSLAKKADTRTARQRQATGAVQRALDADVRLLKGKVTAATDGEGLPGVAVSVQGTRVSTVTDANGGYALPVPAEGGVLVFSFIGFEPQEVAVADSASLHVTLKEDVTALSEVVVISGYGSANDRDHSAATFTPAAPQGRKRDYSDYLRGAIAYPRPALSAEVEGRVTVRFTVQSDGRLTDFEILKGIGHGCDEELIRAIKAGPTWKPATRGDDKVSDKVKVRYRFELP